MCCVLIFLSVEGQQFFVFDFHRAKNTNLATYKHPDTVCEVGPKTEDAPGATKCLVVTRSNGIRILDEETGDMQDSSPSCGTDKFSLYFSLDLAMG